MTLTDQLFCFKLSIDFKPFVYKIYEYLSCVEPIIWLEKLYHCACEWHVRPNLICHWHRLVSFWQHVVSLVVIKHILAPEVYKSDRMQPEQRSFGIGGVIWHKCKMHLSAYKKYFRASANWKGNRFKMGRKKYGTNSSCQDKRVMTTSYWQIFSLFAEFDITNSKFYSGVWCLQTMKFILVYFSLNSPLSFFPK